MTVRTVSVLAPVAALAVWAVWPTGFYRVSAVLGLLLLGLMARGLMKRYESHALHKRVIGPFADTAASMVGQAPEALKRDMKLDMQIHPDDGLTPIKVTMPVPPEYNPGEGGKKDLVRLANERFAGEWQVSLNMKRYPFYVALSRLADPRIDFSFSELMNKIETIGGPGKIILGAGSSDYVVADIINRYPHVGLSMGTGAGKSSFYRNALGQLSYWGDDEFDICDVKRVSLKGMERIPGLRIHTDVELIWKVVREFRSEMEQRYQDLEYAATELPVTHFKARYLFLEEMNAFTMLSSIRWNEIKDRGDSKREPVWDDIRLIAVMARAVNMHMFGAWQVLLVIAAGGDSQLRDQFGLKILSRFSPQAWDLLVGTRPREPSSSVPGRAVAVLDGERKRFQMPNVSVDDAMNMVMKGRAWAEHNGLTVPTMKRTKPSPRKRAA